MSKEKTIDINNPEAAFVAGYCTALTQVTDMISSRLAEETGREVPEYIVDKHDVQRALKLFALWETRHERE